MSPEFGVVKNAATRVAPVLTVFLTMVSATATTVAEEEAASLDRVEVTGSRIKRAEFEGASPLMIITRKDIEREAFTSLGDLLQRLPFQGGANGAYSITGESIADVRNLGLGRTLVLLNGRRFINLGGVVSHQTGSLDLNTIPIAAVERVEVLLDGASAVYGADAVAGVINIITRKDYRGVEVSAKYGQHAAGDGNQGSGDLTLGAEWARASALLNVSYARLDGIEAQARRIGREPLWGTGVAFGSDASAAGRFQIPDLTANCGDGTGCFASDFGATPVARGSAAAGPLGFRSVEDSVDRLNAREYMYQESPADRWGLYAQGRFQVGAGTWLEADLIYRRSVTRNRIHPMEVRIGGVGLTADGRNIGVHATNPFNFTGQDLSPFETASGDPAALYLLQANRSVTEAGPRNGENDLTTWNLGLELLGESEAWERRIEWALSYVWGRNSNVNRATDIHTLRLEQALGPVADCLAPCVPLDLFGGAGSVTPAMVEWLEVALRDQVAAQLEDVAWQMNTDVADMPAGPLAAAVGFEHRREQGSWSPDPVRVAGNTLASFQPTDGEVLTREAYVEFGIPLFDQLRRSGRVDLTVAARYTDHSRYGAATNGKYGLEWRPFGDLLFRATVQQAFRTPGIDQLFFQRVTRQSGVWAFEEDVCSVAVAEGGTGVVGRLDPAPDDALEAQLLANCTGVAVPFGNLTFTPQIHPATGQILHVPDAGFDPANMYGQVTGYPVIYGGNRELEPEAAISRTIGVVYSFGEEGASVALDFYTLDLRGALRFVSNGGFLEGCYGSGIQSLCGYLNRDADGELITTHSTWINAGRLRTDGVDLSASSGTRRFGPLPGEWRWQVDAHWRHSYEVCQPGGSCTELAGSLSMDFEGVSSLPRFNAVSNLIWSGRGWEIAWRTRFIGSQAEFCPTIFSAAGFPCSARNAQRNRLGSVAYHSLRASVQLVPDRTRLSVGIHNIGDKSAPLSSTPAFATLEGGSLDGSTYEIPGRFVYLSLSVGF